MKGERPPRVPYPAVIKLPGAERTIQVNHCRSPHCENYGIPARSEHAKPGPSEGRDPGYTVGSVGRGAARSIRCKACLDNPPMKSNAGIASELRRMVEGCGLLTAEESLGCRNESCEAYGHPIAFRPIAYRKKGKTSYGAQRWQCKCCGSTIVVNPRRVRLQDRNRRLAADVFSRIANKSPVRGTARGAKLKSNSGYYTTLDFIHARCRSHTGMIDRALIDGRLHLPADMNIQSDGQSYTLNWISRLDRRNAELTCYATVDAKSGYILGMHANFDGGVDPFKVNAEAARTGEMELPEAHRTNTSQYWLVGDELRAGRALARLRKHERRELLAQIQSIYASAETRSDVEDIELHHLDTSYKTPFLSKGLQVHMPYTAYAHWMLLQRLLSGAGVKRLQVNVDIDSMARAAFLCAFVDEVKRGDAHAFFVRYTKFQTIDQRRAILGEANAARAKFRRTLPSEIRKDRREVARLMMKERIAAAQTYGKWADEWVEHPTPTMSEPHKAVSWLTAKDSVDEDRMVDMFLDAGIGRIDNVFMRTRRLFNAFERPVGTSSSHNAVWHGYQPVQPCDGREVPDGLPYCQQLDLPWGRWADARHASRIRQAAARLRGYPVARRVDSARATVAPEGGADLHLDPSKLAATPLDATPAHVRWFGALLGANSTGANMHRIFRATGTLHMVKDARGEPVKNDWEDDVVVDVKYELKPSPHQPLVVDIYGYDLVALGQCTEKLILDNGVVFTGRTRGGSTQCNTGALRKVRMFDVEEQKLQLYPEKAHSPPPPEIDAVVFGIVSSKPLGSSAWARPGFPFSYTEGRAPELKRNMTWSSDALRIVHGGFEITFVRTSGYWKRLVDERSLQHDMVAGVRGKDGSPIDWDSINELTSLLSNFLGWVNHCVSPVFHIKGYRKGRLVYRGYNLHPHPTVQRDRSNWLPLAGGTHHRDMVERTLDAFADKWKENAAENGVFHLALQLLRSKERGSLPNSPPSLLYLRDTFSAVAILTSMLVGSNPHRGRHDTMVRCVKELTIPDQLPVDDVRDDLKRRFAELWRSTDTRQKLGGIQESERASGTLCRPLANVGNWLLHLDDTANAQRLLSLANYQPYFVEVSIWLADLMLMKVVGHRGAYFNRLTGRDERLPWERDVNERGSASGARLGSRCRG